MNKKKTFPILITIFILFHPVERCYSEMSFSLTGAVEFETFLNTYEDQDLKDAFKKNELRGRFLVNYGLENFYLFSAINSYINPTFYKEEEDRDDYRYAEKTTFYRNLQISTNDSEISLNELYLNFSSGKFRIRVGNQIYGWGTADTFNPTSYFNPMDTRELLLKDMDEMTTGIPSVSGMVFFDGYTLETVVAPIHIPALLPLHGNFWSPNLNEDIYRLQVKQGNKLDISLENIALGARLSTTLANTDMSFSLYKGPNKDGILVPTYAELIPNEQILVIVEPQYYNVNMVGFDFSKTLGPVAIMCEAAYSNNMPALIEPDLNNYEDITLPLEVKKTSYIAANIGFNYFIPLTSISFFESHEGESLFLCEYATSTHFDNEVMDSFLSNLITVGYRDSFYNGQITLTLMAVFDAESWSSVLFPQIGYDFQNGFSIRLSYASISGKSDEDDITDPVFFYYKNNDVAALNIRYEF